MKIILKAFLVWNKYSDGIHKQLIYTDTPNQAKVFYIKSYYDDAEYIDLKAIRSPSYDIVMHENEQGARYILEDSIKRKQWRDSLIQLAHDNPTAKVYIWSGQWETYWREDGQGYTKRITEAGIYDIQDAISRVIHCGSEKKIQLEIIK